MAILSGRLRAHKVPVLDISPALIRDFNKAEQQRRQNTSHNLLLKKRSHAFAQAVKHYDDQAMMEAVCVYAEMAELEACTKRCPIFEGEV